VTARCSQNTPELGQILSKLAGKGQNSPADSPDSGRQVA
jgi:hypothetical protein